MYGIFTYIWVMYGINGGKYSIHGWSGNVFYTKKPRYNNYPLVMTHIAMV